MEIKLPTASQVDNLSLKTQLPGTNLKLISRNSDKRLLWYDTKKKIVYAVDNTVALLDQKTIYASYDYGITWKSVYTNPHRIVQFKTLKSGYHLAWMSTSNLRRISPDFSSSTDWMAQTVYQPINVDNGLAENNNGVIMFAEYSALPGINLKIYKSTDDGITFTAIRDNTGLRHWHSLQVDPYTGYFWACSGDSGMENKILVTTDEGVTWTVKAEGTQTDRAVGLAFTHEYIYWGMDSTVAPKIYKSKKDVWSPVLIGDTPDGNSTMGISKTIDGSIIGWTRLENTNVKRDFGNFWIVSNDQIKMVQRFAVNPNVSGAGFSICSSVDDNNVWFAMADDTYMNGILGFVLPINLP